MPKFGIKSTENLKTCHPDLQLLFGVVVREFDCSIICGHRGQDDQNDAYRSGKSQLEWDKSKHNKSPSLAVDVVPYPVDWQDINRFYLFAGYVKKTAELLGISVRWGGDWDSDNNTDDQNFNDLPHWELL
jgi:peptidoglycan L-alanyl-D-glutamate endopeptidase CwlK